jgi:ankyrin repeat protein
MSLLEYVERGETDSVRKLLESRSFANVDQTNADGETVLMIAAQKGFAEIVKLLLAHGANPTLTTPEAEVNALHFACEEGHEEVVDILTRLSDEGGAGMDVNATTSYEWTPAHSAAAHGQYRCLEILLTRGARPDHEDKAKRTPLNYAAKHGHTEAVKCLVKAGARVNHQDALLQTPLHKAASVGSLDTIKVLVTSDADINLLDKDECTAFDLADSLSHASTALYLWLQGTQTKSVKGAGK